MESYSHPVTREPGRAPPRHAHGDLTSLAPHERLPEILVAFSRGSPQPRNQTGVSCIAGRFFTN